MQPAEALSEFAAAPVRVLVHDPAQTEAFATLAREGVSPEYLFRELPDRAAFAGEHARLVEALRDEGVDVIALADVLTEPERAELDRNPNFVYTRDPAITLPWLPGRFLRGSMRKPIRRSEPPVAARALEELGLRELFALTPDVHLEGGDVIPLGVRGRRVLLVGFGPRTSLSAVEDLRRRLLPDALDELVALELVPERMNLDGALVPVTEDTVLVEPTSIVRTIVFGADGERNVELRAFLRDAGLEPVEVTREEATAQQACNIVCLGGRRAIAYDLCPRVLTALGERDIDVRTIPGTELIKGTGGPRCMTRPLYC